MSAGNMFAPPPGRFGTHPVFTKGQVFSNIANSATTTYNFGGVPAVSYINRATVSSTVLAASAGGTITGVLQKYDAVTNTPVVLTAAIDLETLTTREGSALVFLATTTEAQRTLRPGDTLEFAVTASGTVDTQPTFLVVNTELLVQA